MAEEEAGFTFVDKRRSQAAEAPDEPAAAAETAAAPDTDPAGIDADLGDDDLGDVPPDIYGVLGYCISLLATEAWHHLGLMANPQTGEAVADLAQAKIAIDALGDLAARMEAAPEEWVPPVMRRDLKTLLNDLRLNYVAQRGGPSASRN